MTKLSLKELDKQIVAADAAAKEYALQAEVHKIVARAFRREKIHYNIEKKGKV